jgi:plasmid stabilization system protein ParE
VARQVTWTETAWGDLEGTADYIAKDSPRYAEACVREMREAARSLAHLAERGRAVPEFNDASVRELLVRNYRLIYRLTATQCVIIAIIHGARDLWLLWEREGRSRSVEP